MSTWAPAVYFVLGQAGWFACVLSAAHGRSSIGIGLVAVLVALHLVRVARPVPELKLLLSVTVVGALWESALAYRGVLIYPADSIVIAGAAPAWVPALWMSFAAQFNTTYRWLKGRPGAAALLGMIAGPVSFRSGAALGALQFARPWAAVLTLALGWGALLPMVVLLSRRWDGVRPTPTVP